MVKFMEMKTNKMVALADSAAVYSTDSSLLTSQKAVPTVELKSRSVIGPSRNTLVPNRLYVSIFISDNL